MANWVERYIKLAREVSTWSKDPSRQIGAVVISNSGQVLAQGYNGFPRGIFDRPERYNNRELKYKLVVHAEMNCIYNATRNGTSLNGASLYVWGLPVCNECAKGIIQVGITNVIWSTNEEIPPIWEESMRLTQQMFNESGIDFNRYEISG